MLGVGRGPRSLSDEQIMFAGAMAYHDGWAGQIAIAPAWAQVPGRPKLSSSPAPQVMLKQLEDRFGGLHIAACMGVAVAGIASH